MLPMLLMLLAFAGYAGLTSGRLAGAQGVVMQAIGGAAQQAGLAISAVTVEGNSNVTREAIDAALALDPGATLFSFDQAAAEHRLAGLGWVARAHVRRLWPTTLAVTIVERVPFAVWVRGERLDAVDRDGAILAPVGPADYLSLPRVAGEDAPQAVAALVDALADYPALRGGLTLATRISARGWRLTRHRAADVLLPDSALAPALAEAGALGVFEPAFAPDIAVVDLRLPGGAVLSLRDPALAAAETFAAHYRPPAPGGATASGAVR